MRRASGLLATLRRWFDTASAPPAADGDEQRVDWVRILPFLFLHAGCLGVIWTGWSWTAVAVAAGLYALRMFAITGFYHRYFSHRSFSTSRPAQLAFALLGASSVQRGPLWWAAHHRLHHARSDEEEDVHSPVRHGFWWSHVGWITSPPNFRTRLEVVPDLARYPELRFLDRFDTLVPLALAAALFLAGELLQALAPGLGTSGPQLLVWGFFISTVVLFHATCTINSLSHQVGRRDYDTRDESRNSLLLALLTFGEGWHNNHHFYPAAARQGFRWWQVDLTYYGLKLLEGLGIVHGLKPVPAHVLARRRAA